MGPRYTLGIEEEIILVEPGSGAPAQRGDEILSRLSQLLAGHISAETHACLVELRTGTHTDLASAVAQLSLLRERLARELERMDLFAASAGMHPLGTPEPTKVSGRKRYRQLEDSLRWLVRREPTAALHVHVGVPSAADAIRVLNRFREAVPLLLALSANSPFRAGSDTGFASARTVELDAFPRFGPPRFFDSYADYVAAVDPLIEAGAIPDPTFLWWDVRLQPKLGTVEVRVMDAQTSVQETAALVALIRSLARLELTKAVPCAPTGQEVLSENRFLAARDGIEAQLIDPRSGTLLPVRMLAAETLAACRPHATALHCSAELEQVMRLLEAGGAERQRRWAQQEGELGSLVATLVDRFTESSGLYFNSMPAAERST